MMSLDLDKIASLTTNEEKVALIQEWIDNQLNPQDISIFLVEEIIHDSNASGWIGYCTNFLTVIVRENQSTLLPLGTKEFIEVLEKTSYFSQKRILWEFQLSKITNPDPVMERYLERVIKLASGPEAVFLKKIHTELLIKSYPKVQSDDVEKIDSLDMFIALERDKKLAWLLKVGSEKVPFPDFISLVVQSEEDSYVLVHLAKYFPELILKHQSLNRDQIFMLFEPLRKRDHAKIREALIEGLSGIFEGRNLNQNFIEFCISFATDNDTRVKHAALKLIQYFPRASLIPTLTASIQDCKIHEELHSYIWLLNELDLQEEFEAEIADVLAKLNRSRGLEAPPTSPLVDKEESNIENSESNRELEREIVDQSLSQNKAESSSDWSFRWTHDSIENSELKTKNRTRWEILGLISVGSFLAAFFYMQEFEGQKSQMSRLDAPKLPPRKGVVNQKIQEISDKERVLKHYVAGMHHLTRHDYQKALVSLTRSAELNHLDSLLKIAWMYEEGIGVEINYSHCKYWLLKAVDLGSKDAEVRLGEVFLKEEESEAENATRAYEIFIKYAEMGHPRAQNNLAMMLLEGRGVPRNPKLAQKWLKVASEAGYAPAGINLKELDRSSNLY